MKPVHVFNVIPSLPPALEGLRQLAYNLRWAWNHDTIELFRRLDSGLWESTGHNPLLMLGTIDQAQLGVAAELYLGRLDSGGEITAGVAMPMQPAGRSPDGFRIFEAAAAPCGRSGLHGYTVRVFPFHPDEPKALLPALITWADAK